MFSIFTCMATVEVVDFLEALEALPGLDDLTSLDLGVEAVSDVNLSANSSATREYCEGVGMGLEGGR